MSLVLPLSHHRGLLTLQFTISAKVISSFLHNFKIFYKQIDLDQER